MLIFLNCSFLGISYCHLDIVKDMLCQYHLTLISREVFRYLTCMVMKNALYGIMEDIRA